MTDRWQQVEKLCQEALELQESERGAFLEKACAGDKELRREVESLLKFESSGDGFIEAPALEVAAKMVAVEPHSLIGQHLDCYQILSLLGAGGMGVVYEARDTRLKRRVALKLLPADRVSDPERKRRFIQEAQAASALNHPNIITIHDIGNERGIDFIVMEYVEGKTLDQRISRKGMKLEGALKIAIQTADALARAHSAGIIHRDLKPSNVMVSDDGLVKVLDFGLAKLTEVGSGTGETLTRESLTEEGMIVGTVAYMSPEQAEGKKVDARSDIFSFGAVLYEMLTGQKAFPGDSKMSTLTAVIKEEPKPISQLVPRDLEKIINRCLRKDLRQRFQHMDDLKVELEEVRKDSDSDTLAATQPEVPSNRRAWVWAGVGILLAAIAVAGWFFRSSTGGPVAALEAIPLTSYPGSERSPSFSPDGNQLAFSWNGEKQDNYDIYLKLIGSSTPEQLTTDPAADVSPAFSPDGRSIGFVRISKGQATFIIIPAIGGPERIVAEIPALRPADWIGQAFAWLPNGKWVITDGLVLLSTESGEKRSLTSPPTKSSFDSSPAVSPNGRTVAFLRSSGYMTSDIYLIDLTDELKFDAEPRLLTSGRKGGIWGFAWTPNGREIIFSSGTMTKTGLWRVPASGAGEPAQLPLSIGEARYLTISQSGNRLAYQTSAADSNIWRLSLAAPGVASGRPGRLIASTRLEMAPQYSPNGKRIAFESDRSGVYGIWVSDADGSQSGDLSLQPGASCGDPRWSPDGQRIAFDCTREENIDIYVLRASGGRPIRVTTELGDDMAPSWSRDGKWVYFTSARTGRYEVWKVSPEGGKAVPVTSNGGGTAFESPEGKSVYYIKEERYSPGGLWKIPVSGGEERQVLPSVINRAFALVNEGIYFIPLPGADGKYSIQFLSFATGKVKTVAPMSAPPNEGLSVSPDGRSLLFTQGDELGSDLMLVENFR
jgi:serine/threonine protein kinase